MAENIVERDLTAIAGAIAGREISAEAAVSEFKKRIETLNPQINAYITVNDHCVEQAREIDVRLKKGENVGCLAGVPIAIKDMFCTKGLRTTAASKMLHNFVPTYSATVVKRLEEQGAIVMGKTNQDEFAMGSSNETSYFGNCKNPWNFEYVPGGSSGGSAAAVSARMAAGAIGTDTGGSIRQPANFCSLVGVKPTYGRVSRYGIVSFASSLDQAGPMTRTVRDAAIILEVISGRDELDSTSAPNDVPKWSERLSSDVRGMKIGMPKEYFQNGLDENVSKTVKRAADLLREKGAELIEISLPLTKFAVPIYYLVSACEASSNLSRYDGVRYGYRADFSKQAAADLDEFYCRNRGEGFGREVKRRIVLGAYALSSGYYDAYYKKACQVRRLLRQDFTDAFKKCDVILSPASPTPAFKIGERIDNPLAMYLNDIYTTSANLAGLPGMSVPGGFSKDNLPIGVQLLAAQFEEQKMFNVALAIEENLNLTKEVPRGLQ